MRKNVFNLYASADDLKGVLGEVEPGRTLRYVALEDELNPNLSIWRAAADIPDFIQPKSPGLPRRLYIMATDEQLLPEPRDHITGKIWYSLYPKDMNSAVVLQEGGAFQERYRPSMLFLHGSEAATQLLFDDIKKLIKKRFKAANGYRVGPDYWQALENGVQFAPNFTVNSKW